MKGLTTGCTLDKYTMKYTFMNVFISVVVRCLPQQTGHSLDDSICFFKHAEQHKNLHGVNWMGLFNTSEQIEQCTSDGQRFIGRGCG